jgi:F-type H+-transporting ATPase subunit b
LDLLKTLGFNPFIVLIQMAGFLLLYAVLRNLLWKPVGDVIDQRKADWKKSEAGIEAAQHRREGLEKEYAEKIGAAERAAYERMQALVREGVSARGDALARSQEEAARTAQAGVAAVRAERDAALKAAGPQVDALARDAAARALGGRA